MKNDDSNHTNTDEKSAGEKAEQKKFFQQLLKDKTAKWTAVFLIALVFVFLFILCVQGGNLYNLGILATGALAAICFGMYFKSGKPSEYLITGIVCAVITVLGIVASFISY